MPIRGQLRWLAFIGICGLLIFSAVAFTALFQIEVNGPLYHRISLSSRIIADYVPPSQSLLEPALICAEVAAAPDAESLHRDAERLKVFRREFNRQHAQYLARMPEGELKAMTRGEAYQTAQEYFGLGDFLVALVSEGHVEQARKLLVSTMNPLYDRHAAAVDQIVMRASEEARSTEALAAHSVRFLTTAMAAFGLLVLIAVGSLSAVIARGIAAQADQLILSEESRRQQVQLLESVVTSMAEGVVSITVDRKIHVWNEEATRLLGPKPLEYDDNTSARSVGVHLADGVTPIPPERSPLLLAMNGQVSNTDLVLKNPRHPAPLWLEVNGRPIRDASGAITGGVIVFRDTTERKRDLAERHEREQELRQTNRALRILSRCNASLVREESESALLREVCSIAVEQAGYQLAVVGYTDPNATDSGSQRSIHLVTSLSQDGATGVPCDGVPNGAGELICQAMSDAVLAGRPELRTAYLGSASGLLLSVPLVGIDAVFGALSVWSRNPDTIDSKETNLLKEVADCLTHGITALRLKQERAEMMVALEQAKSDLEGRVEQRTVELVAAKEAAESADRLKSSFLATMSHELRTPLNSIIGFTGILVQRLAGPLNEEQSKQLEMVRGSARHLLSLINDVLDISKIEAGELEVRAQSFDVRSSLEKVIGAIRPLAEKKGLALRLETSSLGQIVSDQRRVEQVLLNLLNNAVKFTEHGEVTLSGELLADFKLLDTPRPCIQFRVTDTGIGIQPEDLATVFQPFRQVDAGLTRHHEGTGLGLAICRRLAGLLGGDLQAESQYGSGSVFTCTLPLERER